MCSRTWTAAAALAGSLVLAGCGEGASSDAESPSDDEAGGGTQSEDDGADEDPVEGAVPAPAGSAADLTAVLRDADGNEVGEVELTATGDGTELRVEVQGLPPGFHGTHVHTNPACEPASTDPEDPSQSGDFLSAGGHLGAEETEHGAHPGDLPPLYVAEAGGGVLLT
ncbi:superoxide dismutase family protein, partial [Georgenia sp. 10Sc9-8]|nr:superoxide dismutase family protein [Georgenia halotolerans]